MPKKIGEEILDLPRSKGMIVLASPIVTFDKRFPSRTALVVISLFVLNIFDWINYFSI